MDYKESPGEHPQKVVRANVRGKGSWWKATTGIAPPLVESTSYSYLRCYQMQMSHPAETCQDVMHRLSLARWLRLRTSAPHFHVPLLPRIIVYFSTDGCRSTIDIGAGL